MIPPSLILVNSELPSTMFRIGNGPLLDSLRQSARIMGTGSSTFARTMLGRGIANPDAVPDKPCSTKSVSTSPPETPKPEQPPKQVSKRARGRNPHPIWVQAEQQITCWIDDQGPPEPGDGGEARLIKLTEDYLQRRGHRFARSTAATHVKACIDRYRAQPPVSPPQPPPDNLPVKSVKPVKDSVE